MFKLTTEQNEAIKILKSGSNVFLSGKAGTGKSTIINYFIEHTKNKNVLVMASTGIAAVNIGGVTVHRGFKIGGGFQTPSKSLKSANPPKTIINSDIIIIDEISMIRIDIFEVIARKIRQANKLRKSKRKKEIQLVFVGDFCQLPPVVNSSEKQAMKHYYGNKKFPFESNYWKLLKLTPVILQDVHRQDDNDFVDILNEIRLGETSSIDHINLFSSPSFLEGGITLTGLNAEATEINSAALAKLSGDVHAYQMVKSGSVKTSDINPEETLLLKVGARVMFLTNTDEFKNGELGTVHELKEESVIVQKDVDGSFVEVSWGFWKIHDYKIKETKSKKNGKTVVKQEVEVIDVGSYKQIPLKLSYAITIHKSQGQTFDRVNLNPYAWDDGQEYVALSRARSLKGVYLINPIKPEYIKCNEVVKKFYKKISK